MFKKLRNRLIFINLIITTLVIVVVFTMIYLISTKTAENRPPRVDFNASEEEVPDDIEKVVLLSILEEKKTAANNLLITLIISGLAIEVAVAIVSFFLAEEAIKPVKEAYEAQKVFIANASHEIKTPLAAISANLEAADIKNNKWISNVEFETAKLTVLNSELLTLARTDLTATTTTTEVDLKELVLKVLNSFEPRLGKKTLTKQLSIDKRIKINAADFEQILSILIDNAIKYSDKNIIVKLDQHSLSVANDGTKIPSEKITHIFDRFYQVDKSSEGVGLGLSIAKALADKNHWKLQAKSVKNTTFTLFFNA